MDCHVTTDFQDDFAGCKGTWNEARLREYVRVFAEHGFSAIHYICNGDRDTGKWGARGGDDYLSAAREFVEEVPNPIAVVCDEAHERGIKAYATLKIHDMAQCGSLVSYPAGGSPKPTPGIPHVGLEGRSAFKWLRDHPDRRIELHPSLLEPKTPRRPIRVIRLWNAFERCGPVPELSVWVSRDNGTYTRCDGEYSVSVHMRRRRPPAFAHAPQKTFGHERVCTCVEISGLHIAEDFLAVGFETGCFRLANDLEALAEIEDVDGNSVVFTCGFLPVRGVGRGAPPPGAWQHRGIAFDCPEYMPWDFPPQHGVYSYRDYQLSLEHFDCIGFARGRNRYMGGPVELAYPEVRQWLFDFIQEEIDAGVDGVDVRWTSHSWNFDHENYGFGRPVIDAYRERYGVDIATEPFDRALWQKLRGEYFDLFLAAASKLVRTQGKEFFVHIEGRPFMATPECPDRPSRFNMVYNWRHWIEAGLVDAVNFKLFHYERGDIVNREWYDEARSCCDRLGVRKLFTPRVANVCQDLVRLVRDDGFAVCNMYEAAALIRLGPGGFEILAPDLLKLPADLS